MHPALFLILPLGAIGVRLEVDMEGSMGEQAANDDAQEALIKQVTTGAKMGKKLELELSCESLPKFLTVATAEALAIFAQVCGGSGTCTNETYTMREEEGLEGHLFNIQTMIGGLVVEAHKRLCLVSVMETPEVKGNISQLLTFVQPLLQSGGSEEGNRRLKTAYSQLVAWQYGTLELASQAVDRAFLVPTDIEDKDRCPSPCKRCSRKKHHFGKTHSFAFKCTLKRGDSPPSLPGMTCQVSKNLISNLFGKRAWCEVEDWEAAACQQVWVSNQLECGARSVSSALKMGGEETGDFQECLRQRQSAKGNETAAAAAQGGEVLPRWTETAFGVFASLGMASGLTAMQTAMQTAQGNTLDAKGPDDASRSSALAFLQPFTLGGSVEVDEARVAEFASNTLGGLECLHVVEQLEKNKNWWQSRRLWDLFFGLLVVGGVTSVLSLPMATNLWPFQPPKPPDNWTITGEGCRNARGDCIETNNFLGKYGLSASCAIQLHHALHMTVEKFDVEQRYDTLTVNGIAYHGEYSKQLTPQNVQGVIKWSSDWMYAAGGWKICFEELQGSPVVVATGKTRDSGGEGRFVG